MLRQAGATLLTSSLRELDGSTDLNAVIRAMTEGFTAWERVLKRQAEPFLFQLYNIGAQASAAELGFTFDALAADPNVVRWLANQPTGLVPALKGLVEAEQEHVEEVIRRSFEEGTPFDLPDVTRALREKTEVSVSRARLIVRTETTKAVGMGRLAAWEQDTERAWYDYHWVATLDGRHKLISEKLMREGPYEFEEIKQLWVHQEAWVYDPVKRRWVYQIGHYNCRCTITRTLKSRARLERETSLSVAELDELYGLEAR